MITYLTIQNTYHDIQIALCRGHTILELAQTNKIEASKLLMPLAASILEKNNQPLSSLKFIASNMGPGPFTTLRTVLASVNGLAFATGIPLIGIDALDALIFETKSLSVRSNEISSVRPEELRDKSEFSSSVRPDLLRDHSFSVRPACPSTLEERSRVALLNAFNQDVYFAISHTHTLQRGCTKAPTLIIQLAEQFPHGPIQFVGNGALMHKELIMQTFGARAIMHEPIVESPSIETIAHMALQKWEKQEGLVEQLLPVYLK